MQGAIPNTPPGTDIHTITRFYEGRKPCSEEPGKTLVIPASGKPDCARDRHRTSAQALPADTNLWLMHWDLWQLCKTQQLTELLHQLRAMRLGKHISQLLICVYSTHTYLPSTY